jgi:uncharacterized membrane protein YbhN (UPF0104 family)
MGILWEMREERDGEKRFHVYRQVRLWLFFVIFPIFILMAFGTSFVPESVNNTLFFVLFGFILFNFFEVREMFLAQFKGKEIRYLRSKESTLPTFLKPYEYWIEQ